VVFCFLFTLADLNSLLRGSELVVIQRTFASK